MDIDKEYLLLETMYQKKYNSEEKIFPSEWYNVKEYELKKTILKECLAHNIFIKDSSFYYQFKMIALNSNGDINENS